MLPKQQKNVFQNMMNERATVKVADKTFHLYIPQGRIEQEVHRVALELSRTYIGLRDKEGRPPLLMPILNGAYMFAADLTRALPFDAEICFVKMASYSGDTSMGNVTTLIGFPNDIRGRNVIVIEDIVDTGLSMQAVLQQLQTLEVASARVCTFLYKPGKFQGNFKVDYVGLSIEDAFIVGYGMDYNGKGRFFKDIYTVDEKIPCME